MSSQIIVVGKLERGKVTYFDNSKGQKSGSIEVDGFGEIISFHQSAHWLLESRGERRCRFYGRSNSRKEVHAGNIVYFVREPGDGGVKALYWCFESDIRRHKKASHRRKTQSNANYWKVTRQHASIPPTHSIINKGYSVIQTPSA